MIRINNQEYESFGFVQPEDKFVITRLTQMTDTEVIEFSLDECMKTSCIPVVKDFLKKFSLQMDIRTILLGLPLLRNEPNDYVVFVIDLIERFNNPPSATSVNSKLYPNGFYTTESLKSRIEWLLNNTELLKETSKIILSKMINY